MNRRSTRILSLGSALQDIYLIDRDDLTPTPIGEESIFGKMLVGSKVDIDKLSYEVGGGGVNSAITFARNGHEAMLMANIGRDAAGAAVLKVLDREGIDSSLISYAERKATGTSVVLLDAKGGERTILTHRGASEQFDNFDAKTLEAVQPDWMYITTLRGDLATLKRFLVAARGLRVKVMMNPGVKELAQAAELLRLLPEVAVLLVNKSEAMQLVPGKTLEELAYHLGGYCETVIITDGARGGIATSSAERGIKVKPADHEAPQGEGSAGARVTYRFGIYEDRRVRDATGAGDAFGSGFLAQYAAGRPLRQALIFASANSTSVVARIGANRGILTGQEDLHPMVIQKLDN